MFLVGEWCMSGGIPAPMSGGWGRVLDAKESTPLLIIAGCILPVFYSIGFLCSTLLGPLGLTQSLFRILLTLTTLHILLCQRQ